MKSLKTTLFVASLLPLLCVAGAMARPASTFAKQYVLSDGSTLGVRSFGDEHYRFATTSDGLLVERGARGDFFYVGSDGLRSEVMAKDAAFRSSEENDFVTGIDQDAARFNHKAQKGWRYQEPEPAADNKSVTAGTFVKRMRPRVENWVIGERYIPVVLISTPGLAAVDSARMWRFYNEKGYSDEGNIGSVRDFYLESSNGKFNPHFDIFPVKITKELSQYVLGDSLMENVLTRECIDLLVKRADFSVEKYVSNKNKKLVDGIFFLFPGREEDALVYSEDYWAHMFWMQANGANNKTRSPFGYQAANGYTFDKYVLVSQLEDYDNDEYYRNGNLNKLGIYVHEFAHVLGLMDHYGINNAGEQVLGAAAYDLMSSGMYNEYGRVPVKFNAFERETMGWLTLTELSQDTGVIKLGDIDQGVAYSVTNPANKDEYYVVEYRPAKGYDSGVTNGPDYAYNGVWVWYIYYELEAWEMNNVNGMDDFNRVDIKKSLVNNSMFGSEKSYSPLKYRSGSVSTIPGVFNFVKSGDTLACFTLNASVKVDKCGDPVTVSSSSVVASSSSVVSSSSAAKPLSSSSEASSSSVEVPPSSAMVVASDMRVLPRFSTSLEGRRLSVIADAKGTKVVRVFDMQGNEVMHSGFAGNTATLDLSHLAQGRYAVAVSTSIEQLGISTLQLR